MAAKKITITVPEELADDLARAAQDDGLPVSRLVSEAAAHLMRVRAGRAAVKEWVKEHGEFSEAELAETRAKMLAAEDDARIRYGSLSSSAAA